MRIAYIVPRCLPTNGHGRYVLELVRALPPGHDVHIFSSAFPNPADLPAVLHRVPLPDRPAIARLGAWWAASPLLVGRLRFDVVHTHGADAPVGTVVTAPCCNGAIRAAVRDADGENTGAYARPRPSWLIRLNGRIAEAADAHCMSRNHVRRIIVPSSHVSRELETLYDLPAVKMALVPHGVDTRHFSPEAARARRDGARQALGFRASDLVAVFVGGAYRLKGLPALLEAIRLLPDTRLRLLVVGADRTAELAAEERRGLAGRIFFAGRVPNVREAYAAADFFVLPTLYDGFSFSTLEAMACGLPVVVSRRAGVADLLTDGVEAFLLSDPRDPREMGRALERLGSDTALLARMGLAARATAEKYSSAEMARRTMEVYRESVDATSAVRV